MSVPEDCAVPPVAASEDAEASKAASLTPEGEEEKAILDNLLYMNDFLKNVRTKEGDLSSDTKIELSKLRTECDRIFGRFGAEGKPDDANLEVKKLQGAIPKNKTCMSVKIETSDRKTAKGRKSSTSSDHSQSSSASRTSESSSSSCSSPVRKRSGREKGSRHGTKSSKHDHFRAIEQARPKMDISKAPVLKTFSEDSSMSLKEYLEIFEMYCRQVCSGTNTYFWMGELETHLSGSVREALDTLWSTSDTWETLKRKLLKWYDADKLTRRAKFKTKFYQAKQIRGENVFLLATRMEKLFEVAYPNKSFEYSKTLRNRYLSLVPSDFQSYLKGKVISGRMKGKPIKWSKIKRMASIYEQGEKQAEAEEEIVINIAAGAQRRGCDGCCQERFEPVVQKGNGIGANISYYERKNDLPSDSVMARTNVPQAHSRFAPPPQHLTKKNIKCFHCKKIGHAIAECRFKNNACFACGSVQHRIANCPERSVRENRRRSSLPGSGSTSYGNNYRENHHGYRQGGMQGYQANHSSSSNAQPTATHTRRNSGNSAALARREGGQRFSARNPPMSE